MKVLVRHVAACFTLTLSSNHLFPSPPAIFAAVVFTAPDWLMRGLIRGIAAQTGTLDAGSVRDALSKEVQANSGPTPTDRHEMHSNLRSTTKHGVK